MRRATAVAASLLSSGEFHSHRVGLNILMGVRGINEGRQAARDVDLYLENCTGLPITGGIVKNTAVEVLQAMAK